MYRYSLFVALSFVTLTAAEPKSSPAKTEPTNATEAAAKKAAEDKALDARYQKWKAGLSPAEQAWETVLEQNLGGFYLPIHKREKVAGKSNAWDFVADDPKLPRVLLIGDSVSRGYTLAARKALAGRANVHRAPENCGPTSNGLKKLDVWLGGGKWDVIHFNFGIHDRATKPADYEQHLEAIVTRLKATGARVIWASTTPIPPDTKDGRLPRLPSRRRTASPHKSRPGISSPPTTSLPSSRPTSARCRTPRTSTSPAKAMNCWVSRWRSRS